MTRFCIITLYETKATTSVILADGDMIPIAQIERNAILRAWGERANRDPFRFHDHLIPACNISRGLRLSNERANTP